jgi:purine-binding chemotaxis protein CheW
METDPQEKKNDEVLGHDPFTDLSQEVWEDTTASPEPEMPDEADFALPDLDMAGEDDPFAALEAEMLAEVNALEGEAAVETAVPDNYLDSLVATIDQEIDALHSLDVTGGHQTETGTAVAAGEQLHIIFALDQVEYAVPISNVTEMGRPPEITRVPNVPGWVIGIANLRGDVISVVDMRGFLGLPPHDWRVNGRLLVTQSHSEEITVGLIVDRVTGLGNLQTARIGAPTAPIEDQVTPYLRGVYEYQGRLLVVLNLDNLLLSTEMQQFEPV